MAALGARFSTDSSTCLKSKTNYDQDAVLIHKNIKSYDVVVYSENWEFCLYHYVRQICIPDITLYGDLLFKLK